MSRSVLSSCILMLACQIATAEDLPASDATHATQSELQLQDIVVVLLDHCQISDCGAVLPKTDAPRLERIAASIVEIRPNGNLKIEGRSEVAIGDEVWEHSLTGEVRRQALGPDRTVHSNDVAKRRIRIRKNKIVHNDAAPIGVMPNPVRQVSAQSPVAAVVAELRQKQTELNQLQQEIRQLRVETGTQQQFLVRVQMLEFSLTKLKTLGVEIPGRSSGYFSGVDLSRILAKTKAREPGPYPPPNSAANSNEVSSVVEWMKGNSIGKVLAEPTIIVADGRPASLNVGGEIPMPANDNSKAVEYQPIGTQLDLLATSLGGDRVRLELKLRISEADYGKSVQINGTPCPAINVRQIDTGIDSSFGEPTVLTGMIEKRTEAVRTDAGVRENVNEICTMLVVTPERVDAPETAQRSLAPRTPR